jgi:hypothetical protein
VPETADPPMIAAHRAFERGDFREARRLAAELLRAAPDEPTRAAAAAMLKRFAPDPLVIALTAGCALFFVLILIFGAAR